MMSKEIRWSYLNEITGRQVDGLTIPQADLVFSLIPKDERYSWLFWHDGLNEWKPLEECSEFIAESAPPTKPPEKPILAASAEAKETAKEEVKEVTNTPAHRTLHSDKRLTRRFDKVFKVEIRLADSQVFSTTTANISMGGLLLKDDLPDSLGKNFEVILSNIGGAHLKLFCSVLRVPNGQSPSNRIRIVGTNQEGLLRTWLLEHR